ncbi:MAG: hypothetical protein WCA82_06465 [Jiangellales bacterium]
MPEELQAFSYPELPELIAPFAGTRRGLSRPEAVAMSTDSASVGGW